MSQTQQNELTTITQPDVVTTPSRSLHRPSIASLQHHHGVPSNSASLHTLDHAPTAVTSKAQAAIVIASVSLITAVGALLNGLITVALPHIAEELSIPDNLLLWPSSINALTSGCTLLLSGSLADALGFRFMYLIGCVLQAAFVLGSGLSQHPMQMILFRGLSGIAMSFCLPSAVAIITRSFVGKRRDIAFATMGGGQPIGFSLGLALGGVLTDTIGWRWGFYMAAILSTSVFAMAMWGLPKSIDDPVDSRGPVNSSWNAKWQQLKGDIDWVGAIIASISLAALSYVFAAITGRTADIRQPSSIALLAVAFALIPAFIFWVGRQEKLGRPAIIPNSLWRNKMFTTICVAVFLTWGSFNALETILTFYFQKVQMLSATQTSIRFLPEPVSGTLANIFMGLIVHRIKANYLVLGACGLSLIAPLVLCFVSPNTSYWRAAFIANIFNPVGADALFTIANLLITSFFPAKTQALAGGVFNTVSQIGKSVGLALVAVIAASTTARSEDVDKASPEALLEGYKATFWFCFATIVATLSISLLGLGGVGKVGHKRD